MTEYTLELQADDEVIAIWVVRTRDDDGGGFDLKDGSALTRLIGQLIDEIEDHLDGVL